MTDAVTRPFDLCADDAVGSPRDGMRLRLIGPLRLDVVAVTAADVVASAGGWLVNRARTGWAVRVYLDEYRDTRAMQILGAEVFPLHSFAGVPDPGGRPHVLAAAGDVIIGDGRVRADVVSALTHAQGRVITWGDSSLLANLGPRAERFQYQLNSAAAAFKKHALRAAGADGEGTRDTEEFGGHMGAFGPCDWDLTPITIARQLHRSIHPVPEPSDSHA